MVILIMMLMHVNLTQCNFLIVFHNYEYYDHDSDK